MTPNCDPLTSKVSLGSSSRWASIIRPDLPLGQPAGSLADRRRLPRLTERLKVGAGAELLEHGLGRRELHIGRILVAELAAGLAGSPVRLLGLVERPPQAVELPNW
jgi:hypothetical protein